MNIQLQQGDITRLSVDAIVNAANSSLLGGSGVDGAIHRAGGPAILEECRLIGGCETGLAVITTAGNLPSRFVIHTVGPVWNGGNNHEADLLASCYRKSLALADEYKLVSIAFPNISTGIYRFPKKHAAETAIGTVKAHKPIHLKEVIFICFDEENFRLYQELL